MKKSKVLIPAMALLLFSTAASITGTVAWFTSSRVFQMTAGDFEVAQLDGNLKVELAAGTGTSVAPSGKAISVNDGIKLTDSSVNTNGEVWRLNSEGGDDIYSSLGLDGKTADIDNWFVKELGPSNNKVKYYAAVSWTMTIKYDFASEKGNMGVYLDLKDSQFEDKTSTAQQTANAGKKGDSKKGFRIMFIDNGNTTNTTDDDVATVWGNHVPELTATTGYTAYSETADSYAVNDKVIHNGATYKCITAITPVSPAKVGTFDPAKWEATFESTLGVTNSDINLRYVQAANNDTVNATADYVVTDTTDESSANWVKGNYISSVDPTTGTYTRLSDGTENAGFYAERIATIAKPSSGNQGQTTVKCIAWFEGEDPNVVNNTAMQVVGADMTFYTRCDTVTGA